VAAFFGSMGTNERKKWLCFNEFHDDRELLIKMHRGDEEEEQVEIRMLH
jgi:hypothetical protein